MKGQTGLLEIYTDGLRGIVNQLDAMSEMDRKLLDADIREVAESISYVINDMCPPAPKQDSNDVLAARILGIAAGMDALDDRIEYLENVVVKLAKATQQSAGIILEA